MFNLGVTGGIGSGKTTVCRIFERLGARVFYADTESKRILEEDADVRREILAAFGEESYGPDGRPNRPYLAAQVFGDAQKLATINGIIHPRVFAAFEAARAQAERNGVRLFIKEAAILFESGGDRGLDAVLVVEAPIEARIARVVARDSVTPEVVQGRILHQLPPEELRRRADFLIVNDEGPEKLEREVEVLFARLVERT